MGYKILKNKRFHIPTERIKEARKDAEEEEELRRRINEMTDEEYEEYVDQELAKADEEFANGQVIPAEVVMKELDECMYLLDREHRNYENWKRILKIYRTANL